MGGCAEFVTGEGFNIAECLGVLALDGDSEEEDGQPVMRRRARRNGDEANTSFIGASYSSFAKNARLI